MDSTGISFTALYTGQVWVENGLANKTLSTPRGKLLFHCLRPADLLCDKIYGFNLNKTLLQRHQIIDHLLGELILQNPGMQVLEIASGLSSRGIRILETHPAINYVEADLPAMASRKRKLLISMDVVHQPRVFDCDIFSSESIGLSSLFAQAFDKSQPLVVITEGLVNYFELETIAGFWQQLGVQLKAFPSACYLTDLFPDGALQSGSALTQLSLTALAKMTRAKVNLHFDSEDTIIAGFENAGFAKVLVHCPEDYYEKLAIPQTKNASPVRVVQAFV